jgi:hypothetical protein
MSRQMKRNHRKPLGSPAGAVGEQDPRGSVLWESFSFGSEIYRYCWTQPHLMR